MSEDNLNSTSCSDPTCKSRGKIKTDNVKASVEVPKRMKELPKSLTKEAFEACELSPISFEGEKQEVKVLDKILAPSVLSNNAKYGSICLVVRRPG
mmetsp:Transcript_552/g.738  ORF Transcript_552/g.738 Transcript_552/m.738 type:complete len:96 (-) Transcript_552:199-486(-)